MNIAHWCKSHCTQLTRSLCSRARGRMVPISSPCDSRGEFASCSLQSFGVFALVVLTLASANPACIRNCFDIAIGRHECGGRASCALSALFVGIQEGNAPVYVVAICAVSLVSDLKLYRGLIVFRVDLRNRMVAKPDDITGGDVYELCI